jgi:hypothetical protein
MTSEDISSVYHSSAVLAAKYYFRMRSTSFEQGIDSRYLTLQPKGELNDDLLQLLLKHDLHHIQYVIHSILLIVFYSMNFLVCYLPLGSRRRHTFVSES